MATDWFDGRIARRRGATSSLGSLLDPIADKVLVLAVLVMLIEEGVWPAWMVAAIVAREILVSGLRLAAIERGVVIAARDLGKLKTWAQASRGGARRLRRGGRLDDSVAWWALLVALVLTWVSGLDYARSAPRMLRGDRAQSVRYLGGCARRCARTSRGTQPTRPGRRRAASSPARPRP